MPTLPPSVEIVLRGISAVARIAPDAIKLYSTGKRFFSVYLADSEPTGPDDGQVDKEFVAAVVNVLRLLKKGTGP